MQRVEPIMINAALVSAQNRKRLWWVGKLVNGKYQTVDIQQPEDKHIYLKDIIESGVVDRDKSLVITTRYVGFGGSQEDLKRRYFGKSMGQAVFDKPDRIGEVNESKSQANRVYSTEGKSVALSANGGGMGAKTGLYAIIPEATKKGFAVAMEGSSVDLSFPSSKTRRGRVGNKAKNIMTSQNIGVFTNGIIRKLTPIECERLQSLPDGFSEGVSNTQRYKCLGNGFNCKVIEHIYKTLFNL